MNIIIIPLLSEMDTFFSDMILLSPRLPYFKLKSSTMYFKPLRLSPLTSFPKGNIEIIFSVSQSVRSKLSGPLLDEDLISLLIL